MMELTEKTELEIEDSYFHYTINDIIKPVRQQILEHKSFYEKHAKCSFEGEGECCPYIDKAEKWDKYCAGVVTTKEQENKQLKEHIKTHEMTNKVLNDYNNKVVKELEEQSKYINHLRRMLNSQEKK